MVDESLIFLYLLNIYKGSMWCFSSKNIREIYHIKFGKYYNYTYLVKNFSMYKVEPILYSS